jgi:ParB/RepB/Spo0J family partition protein
MPKMEAASLTIKISLAQIIDTGNIREVKKYGPNEKGEYPQEIIDLAMSIKAIDQLQPIVVKFSGEVDGNKQYELIAGFRRRAAFQYLCSIGEDYTMIEARIITGEKLIIQLVENIQREDLTAPEREAAIFQLAENGMKQNEIASQLSKNKAFISINISAFKMRQAAQKAKIDLTGIETSTLSELLSIPEDDILFILRKLVESGGTRAAANTLAMPYKNKKDIQSPAIPPPAVSSNVDTDPDVDPLMAGGEIPAEPIQTEPPKKTIIQTPLKDDPIEVEHREIDLNIVLTVIYDYIKNVEKNGIDGNDRALMINTAKNILALILKKVDDA